MTDLEKYEAVNKCETLEELANVIGQIAENGIVKGRKKDFSAFVMCNDCINFNDRHSTDLTRMYGIRQQAMMILHYSKK